MAKKITKKPRVISEAELEEDYRAALPLARRLQHAVCEQISSIIEENDLTLGVPLESRVKSWESIREKIDRAGLTVKTVVDLRDLVGVRAIFLFRSELDCFQDLIRDAFEIISEEDTAARLGESQFGYQSRHMVFKLPGGWLDLPSLKGLDDLCVEIQIRTVAQHIWAAASHKLQYKREQSVPVPVRRAINRVSALLETVDLEFLRVLEERKAYVEGGPRSGEPDVSINVDNLREILRSNLPPENLDEDEPYDKLLSNLEDLGVDSTSKLVEIIHRHMDAAKKSDRHEVEKRTGSGASFLGTAPERLEKGVFWTHVGFMRQILKQEFGEEVVDDTIARHMKS